MRPRLSGILHTLSNPFIALPSALIIAVVAVVIAWQMAAVTPSGQYATAINAPIVAVGGTNSDLSFQVSGQVAAVPVAIGQQIQTGAALVVLDRSALGAQRLGAVASLEAAQARLAIIKDGTRPEQVSVNQTSVTQSKESLLDAVRSAYINADDAIHNKTDQLLTNPRNTSVALSFTVPDQALQHTVITERLALESVLSTWAAQVNAPTFATSDPLMQASAAQANLARVSAFLDNIAQVLMETPPSSALPLATLQGYQASVNVARLNVSSSMTAITSATTALQSAQGALILAQAGPTTNDIAVAQAAVDAAQAALSGIDVSLRQAALTAPFNGTVTSLNAHIGQTVSPGQVIVSIESTGGSSQNALVVPTSSVIEDNGQAFVYIKGTSTTPMKTVVTTGLVSATGMTEITSGLSKGQEVLTFGTNTK